LRIILGRHAHSAANERHAVYGEVGDSNVPLTDEGWMQAAAAGSFLKKYLRENPYQRPKPVSFFDHPLKCLKQCFNRVTDFISPTKKRAWISSYLRCRQSFTAMALAAAGMLGQYEAKISPLLIEQNYGHNSYIDKSLHDASSFAEAFRLYKIAYKQDPFTAIPPGGESPAQMMPRMYAMIDKIMRDKANGYEDQLIETHGTTLRLFAMAFLKIDPARFKDFPNPENGSLFVIEGGDGVPYTFKQIYDGEKMQAVDIDWGEKLGIYKMTLPSAPDHIKKNLA